jgi:methenyltetrahydromethanopterin cyclohydrolase
MSEQQWRLNEGAGRVADELRDHADVHCVAVLKIAGATVIDAGLKATGSLSAGIALARACLAGRGEVAVTHDRLGAIPCPRVTVHASNPVVPCLLSQYAGWSLAHEKFFAMASGPMRALAKEEDLFEKFGYHETADRAVGVLETGKLPPPALIGELVTRLKVPAEKITLLVAKTASIAGSTQVVT